MEWMLLWLMDTSDGSANKAKSICPFGKKRFLQYINIQNANNNPAIWMIWLEDTYWGSWEPNHWPFSSSTFSTWMIMNESQQRLSLISLCAFNSTQFYVSNLKIHTLHQSIYLSLPVSVHHTKPLCSTLRGGAQTDLNPVPVLKYTWICQTLFPLSRNTSRRMCISLRTRRKIFQFDVILPPSNVNTYSLFAFYTPAL